MELLLSKSTMPLIKYVAWLLGWLMNGIYVVLDTIGIANIGLCIIFFTIIIYIILTPVQIKQQKSSRVMNIIQPELQKVQKKYQGKNDQVSQQKMQEETMALYSKYGVSPTGSCLPLLIQLPILFALYQVIIYIPGYVSRVANLFNGLAAKITSVSGYADTITNFVKVNKVRMYGSGDYTQARIVDFLYTLNPTQWTKLQSEFPALKSDIVATAHNSERINGFLGINITQTPWDAIKNGFTSIFGGTATPIIVGALIAGFAIPILAWFTQWINMKLMPQQTQTDGGDNMARQMNMMNNIMPIFSAFICLSFNMGIGIYWIIGAVVRGVQQVIINRRIVKISTEELIEKAEEKNQKKREKRKDYVSNITENARTNVKKVQTTKNDKTESHYIDSSKYYKDPKTLNQSSITAKANWVLGHDEEIAEKKANKKKNNQARNRKNDTPKETEAETKETATEDQSQGENKDNQDKSNQEA